MKPILSAFITLITCSLNVHAQENPGGPITINGSIENVPDSIPYVYFIYPGYNETDSARVVEGKYTYRLRTPEPLLQVTIFSASPKLSSSYQSPHIAVLLLDGQNVTLKSVDSFSNIQVTGSAAYSEYVKIEEERALQWIEASVLFGELGKLEDEKDFNGANNIQSKIDQIKQHIADTFLAYAKANPVSPVHLYAIARSLEFTTDREKNIAEMRELYKRLPEAQQKTFYGRRIYARIQNETLAIGKMALDFALPDTSGNTISLSSFKGKYVLLDFWASWCGPCLVENKFIKDEFNRYKDKGLAVLAVSIDAPETKDKWLAAIRSHQLYWTQLIDNDGKIKKAYKITSIPRNFLLDPEGHIIEKDLRGARLNAVLRKVFE